MKGLAGKRILVTGASYGIGRAVAIRYAQENADVAINHRNSQEEAQKTKQFCHEECQNNQLKFPIIKSDVAKEEDVKKMVTETIQQLGGLDILINNAGIQIPASSHKMSSQDFHRVLNVNLTGAFFCSKYAIEHFLEHKGGTIINMSSVHQIIPKPGYLSYSISKGGMQNLTRTLALEYANQNIRVNGVGPGATVTPINNEWINDPTKKAIVEKHIPMKRVADPSEVASLCAYLTSDEASYITGQTIFIDGGLTLFGDFQENWAS